MFEIIFLLCVVLIFVAQFYFFLQDFKFRIDKLLLLGAPELLEDALDSFEELLRSNVCPGRFVHYGFVKYVFTSTKSQHKLFNIIQVIEMGVDMKYIK